MKRQTTLILLFAATLVFGQTLLAGETGEVFGTVELEGGYLLPGVTVEMDGAKLAEKRTTVSDEQGVFRFKEVPAGVYGLLFKLEGMKTIKMKGIKAKPGKKIEINARMKFSTIVEEIVIFGVRQAAAAKKQKSKPVKPAAHKAGDIATIVKPRLIKKEVPQYPQEALDRGIEEEVVIAALMTEEGRLTDMKVKKGEHACLIGATLKALGQWQYQPFMINGAPSPTGVTISVQFKLKTK